MQPNYLSDGTTPRITDGHRRVIEKVLGSLQNQAGSFASNNPRKTDTSRQLLVKWEKAKAGIS